MEFENIRPLSPITKNKKGQVSEKKNRNYHFVLSLKQYCIY